MTESLTMSNIPVVDAVMSESLQDAKDLIAIACALGEKIDAVEGMSVWDLHVTNSLQSDPLRVGLYATRKGALRGLRNFVEDRWAGAYHFGPVDEVNELPASSDEEIIEYFYTRHPGEKYFITQVTLHGVEPEYVREER